MPPDLLQLCVAGGLHGFVSVKGCFFIASKAKTIISWRANSPRLQRGKDGEEWSSTGHRAALGQLCSQGRFQPAAESNQTTLGAPCRAGTGPWLPTALPSAGQRGAQQHSRAFVPPLSFLPPDFSPASSLLCVHHPLPAHSSCLVFLPSPNMSSSPFSFCAAPRTSTASQTPPLSLPASPPALLSLSVSPSLTVWGESVCVNARIPLFIG